MDGKVETKRWHRAVGHVAGIVPWVMLVGPFLFWGWHGLWAEPAFWAYFAAAATLMLMIRLLAGWIVKHDVVLWGAAENPRSTTADQA